MFVLPEKQDGGGGPSFRKQLKILKDFVYGFDFIRMKPDDSVIQGGLIPGVTARALVETGKAYAIYVRGGSQIALTLELPAGRYRAEWVNPRTGKTDKIETVMHRGGDIALASPPYSEDIALRLVRK